VVPLGNLRVEVLSTPGHTKGSVVLRCQDVLFSGDTLFAGECGRTDFPGGDYGEMMASLKRLAQLEGDYRVFPGHEQSTTLEQERKTNPYILEALRT
jgi:glyoxylase-like metal-dependent hydrolase (beta-lactamase superfamily II)